MKWSSIKKFAGDINGKKESNQLVALAQQYSQEIRGHTLVCTDVRSLQVIPWNFQTKGGTLLFIYLF
jgi:GH35 family endo-1,4-beta-xylanase